MNNSPINIITGMILWCMHHNCLMVILDDNQGHPAGNYRPVRAQAIDGSFTQAIPSVYFRQPTGGEMAQLVTGTTLSINKS